jgi:hypothetical protein
MAEAPSDTRRKAKRDPRPTRGGSGPRTAKPKERVCCDELDPADFLTWLADAANETATSDGAGATGVRGSGR